MPNVRVRKVLCDSARCLCRFWRTCGKCCVCVCVSETNTTCECERNHKRVIGCVIVRQREMHELRLRRRSSYRIRSSRNARFVCSHDDRAARHPGSIIRTIYYIIYVCTASRSRRSPTSYWSMRVRILQPRTRSSFGRRGAAAAVAAAAAAQPNGCRFIKYNALARLPGGN